MSLAAPVSGFPIGLIAASKLDGRPLAMVNGGMVLRIGSWAERLRSNQSTIEYET